MNQALLGLAMLGASKLASSENPRVTVVVARIPGGGGQWAAELKGDVVRYVSYDSRHAVANSGHQALKKLAESWRRQGFLD